MKNVIDFLESDKEQDKYLDLSKAEQEKLLDDILLFANSNKTELINFCHRTEPGQFCTLELVYEALAKDTETWGDFIYDEFKRIIEGAKTSADPFLYTSCLDVGFCFGNKNAPYAQRIISLLAGELDSPLDGLRHRVLWFLSDWVAEGNELKHASIIEKMADKIRDPNWKIRYLAYILLKERQLPSGYKLKLGFWDMFRAKSTILFSSPFEIP